MSDIYKVVSIMGVLIGIYLIVKNPEGSVGIVNAIGGTIKNNVVALQGRGV